MDVLHLIFLGVAAGASGLAFGLHRESADRREQIEYLRKQLGHEPPPAATQARPDGRALAPVGGR